MHNHIKEFSKQAKNYDSYTIVQKKVAIYLLSKINTPYQKILDLGCGTGYINKNIPWKYETFIAVDSAIGMCEKHPKSKNIKVLNSNFESNDFQKNIKQYAPFDIIISSSSLQWASGIEEIIRYSSKLSSEIAFSIFTCKTFKDIYSFCSLETFLPSCEELIFTCKKYFDIEYEVKTYRLDFEDNISLFNYIKKSGVGGGERKLSITQTRNLIKNYPHKYLEFEVLYMWTR